MPLFLLMLSGCSPPPVESRENVPAPRPPAGSLEHLPLISILDVNRDGALSAAEIEASGKKLMYADRNGDGKLTVGEAEERVAKGAGDQVISVHGGHVWGP